jgi:chromosome segregation ATPase
MDKQLQTITNHLEQLHIKFDTILDDIKDVKNQNQKLTKSLEKLEEDVHNIQHLEKQLESIKQLQNEMKKDTQRMDDHITFVETSMSNLKDRLSLKSFSPFKAITLMNPFKSIEQNNEEYIIREINKDEVMIETKKI